MLRCAFVLCLPFVLGTAASETAWKTVLIEDVPHVAQKPDFCGEACVAMWLQKLGQKVDQDYVFDQSGLDPVLGRGCYTKELARALEVIGFRIGPAWIKVAANDADKQLRAEFARLHADLVKGIPSIVCIHYSDKPKSPEHFRLILGYDAETDEVVYHEPAEQDGGYRRMPLAKFLELWPLKYDPKDWTVVRLRLEPHKLAKGKISTAFTNADYAQHIHKLRERLPHEGFTVVLQKPFVVVGDEPAEAVRKHASGTIKWTVDRLKAAYFEKDPTHILDVWLFQDSGSYETHAEKLFGRKPHTPFGYYSSEHKALVMNIATGGGTLVHEIVHPFIAANFPGCPSWFNEGLASLYEQCGDRDGKICGFTNWRLKGLQKAIREDGVPSFETLCATTTREFYDKDKGTNYGQARYLCYYLQEQGLLVKFYREFRKNVQDDPTGYQTLQAVLGERDMQDFQKRWEAYVLKLEFPG